MTSFRTLPAARGVRPAWKRNTVPSELSDQPAAGARKWAHSPVAGLPIQSTAPMRVGSSVPPGSGATSASRDTIDSRSPLRACFRVRRFPASSSVVCAAAGPGHATTLATTDSATSAARRLT